MYGPNVNVQVVLITGLIGEKFKFPYFLEFDYNITPEYYTYLIKSLYDLECKVLITSCDQATKNGGLRTKLNVSENIEFDTHFIHT